MINLLYFIIYAPGLNLHQKINQKINQSIYFQNDFYLYIIKKKKKKKVKFKLIFQIYFNQNQYKKKFNLT